VTAVLTAEREWVVPLPAGLKVLSLNDRIHWGERDRRNRSIKKAAWAMAINQHVPHLDRARIVVEYQPRPGVQAPDPDNIAPSGKAAIDGLVAARVLPEDNPAHVLSVTCRIGSPHPLGRFVLHITEAP